MPIEFLFSVCYCTTASAAIHRKSLQFICIYGVCVTAEIVNRLFKEQCVIKEGI